MSNVDLIKTSYEAARNEIVVRLRIRSQTIAFYLAASGVLLGIIVKDSSPDGLVFLIALFALAGCLMVTHQNVCIALASSFCGTQLKGKFDGVPMWNNCAVNDKDAMWRRRLRFGSQLIIILFPPLLALVFTSRKLESVFITPENLLTIVVMLIILGVLFISKEYRKRMFNKSGEGCEGA